LHGCGPWLGKAPDAPGYGCRWGPDPNTGHFLTNVTMKKAIAASQIGRVDLLGLNACWMAALEVEYELRGVAGVEIASQVYAKPWPYRAIAEALSRTPAPSAEGLARAIVAAVRAEITAGHRQDAISAFHAGQAFDDLAAAFDIYARRVTALVDSDWPAVREAVMNEALRIDDPLQADLASLVKVLGRHDQRAREAAHAVAWQLSTMRIANAAHRSHLRVQGLSVFCPKDTEVDLADAYQGTEFRTNSWAGFLAKFQARLAAS
ncbi:MAG TPA: clostripain-related cysteine peptidase, partial [Kofleriaceae bacterium]